MTDPEPVDVSTIVCPLTGVTAREAAVGAILARDHLGAWPQTVATTTRGRRIGLVEDIRVLTGVLAMELAVDVPAPDARHDPGHRAALVHEATMRSDSFALCAAVTLLRLDREAGRPSEP